MDPTTIIDLIKVGGPILAIAVVLLWVTIKDKDRMAAELNKDKERILEALVKLTDVVANNTVVMRGVQSAMNVCMRKPEREAGNGG